MSKIPRTSVQGLIKPAQSHSHMDEQVPEQAAEQLRDADVPIVPPETETETETETVAARPATRARRAKAKSAPEPELKDYAHRSLYAKPETLDLIREIAFKERISAQALYREGLFLMLRKRGHYKDKHIDDV